MISSGMDLLTFTGSKKIADAAKMNWKCLFSFLILHQIPLEIEAMKLRSYHYNKKSNQGWKFDCLYTTRDNVSIPGSFSFCFRHKRVFHGNIDVPIDIPIFLGQVTSNWNEIISGVGFDKWEGTPWISLFDPIVGELDVLQIAMAGQMTFSMGTWRHTCISIDFDAGVSIMYENGEKIADNNFKQYKDWRQSWPELLISHIFVGCIPGYRQPSVHGGIVTDFNIFSKIMSEKEMVNWTTCKKRLTGDIINWDQEDWKLRRTGQTNNFEYIKGYSDSINWDQEDNTTISTSTIEFLEYETDICYITQNSYHLFPYVDSFLNTLDFCRKMSSQLNQ